MANGRPLTILPANVVMRAVVVPPHVERIELSFEPFCNARNVAAFLLAAILLGFALERFASRLFPKEGSSA